MPDCTDRNCGNNPKRRVNPNDYDSVMGFLCSACEDEANDPTCPVCGDPKSRHEDERICIEAEDVDDDQIEIGGVA